MTTSAQRMVRVEYAKKRLRRVNTACFILVRIREKRPLTDDEKRRLRNAQATRNRWHHILEESY